MILEAKKKAAEEQTENKEQDLKHYHPKKLFKE